MRDDLQLFIDTLGVNIDDCVRGAHRRFYQKHGDEPMVVSPSAKSALVCDYIYDNLQTAIGDGKSVHFFKRRGSRFISLAGNFLVKIKKLDRRFRPQLNDTIMARRFDRQQTLPGFKNAEHLYLGYVMDLKSPEVDRVVFSCPSRTGFDTEWTIDLSVDERKQMDLLPVAQSSSARRITPKLAQGDQASNGSPL